MTTHGDSGADRRLLRPQVVLHLEYEGTQYRGSQLQRTDNRTVQGAIREALCRLTGQEYRLAAASRTDAGAHALGQVMSFLPRTEMSLQAYETGLNHYLPRDIAVTAVHWAPAGFDVRRSALSRTYRYTVLNRRSRSALWRNRAALVREPLDVETMAKAASSLHGWLDVRPFTGPLPPHRNPLRRFDRAEVSRDGDDIVAIELEASGFLPHQVRRTAGALVKVGAGRLTVEEFRRIVRAGRPGEVAWTMPSAGLCLVHVHYEGFPPQESRIEEDGENQDI